MTVIARHIVSDPVRLATATWTTIVDLLASEENSNARAELLSITGIANALISSEAMKDAAIVAYGSGPRVRIYCLYGEEAIVGEKANETLLVSSPINGDWGMSLPCPKSDLEWVQAALKKKSTRINARDLNTVFEDESEKSASAKSSSINREAFFRL